MNITVTTPSLNSPVQQRSRQANIQRACIAPKVQAANNQVNFTGWSQLLRPIMMERRIKMDKNDMEFLEHASSVLGVDMDKMVELTKGKTVRRMAFLSRMVERFNGDNWGKKLAEREDGQVVIDLFKNVKKPTDTHMTFINKMDFTMTDVKKCFDAVENKPEEIDKILEFNKHLMAPADKKGITLQVISSPNRKEYLANPEKYTPHLNALKDTKGAIAALDKQMVSESVDLISSRASHDVESLLQGLPKSEQLTKEMLIENYTPEGTDMLSNIFLKMKPTEESLNFGDAKGLIKIYKSTTKDNIDFRKDFMEAHYYNFGKRTEMRENEINEIAALFELTEKDPNAKKFIAKMSQGGSNSSICANDYLNLFEKYGSEYLNSNSSRVKKCMRKTSYNSYDKLIQFMEKESKNPVNMFVDAIKGIMGTKAKGMAVNDVVKIDTMEKPSAASLAVSKKPYIKPEIQIVEMQSEPMIKTAVMPDVVPVEAAKKPYIKPEIKAIEMPSEPMIKTAVMPDAVPVEAVEEKKVKPCYRFFKPHVPKQPSAKKLLVIKDVNNIIEKKLGSRVMDEQAKLYADKATKMRAGMLPEIFESIKETRAAARANGTFSRSKTVRNEDAVDLYTRINGKNKKLVNYMLKVRAEDGTRRYTVKDIISVLGDANREILKGKELSTREHRFTAKDERAIYERMFDEKLALYGKLPRKSKKSQKA